MNLLAHAYLSFNHPDILIGNMIGDFVRGNKYKNYPPKVQNGILLHRRIDEFTDLHPINIQTKKIFQPKVRLYSGAFLDISYDHFLAINPDILSPEKWKENIHDWYLSIGKEAQNLPSDFQKMFYYMKAEDWLYNYRYRRQIKQSFQGLVRRAKFLPNETEVFSIFENNYAYLQESFDIFFPQLIAFVKDYMEKLTR